MASTLNLALHERAQRKSLITVAEWETPGEGSATVQHREILGRRVEDSSIELNPDIQTSTDILGITYSDVAKTEPQQTLDPAYIMGGSDLSSYLSDAMLENNIAAYNGKFNVYIISAFIGDATNGYKAVMHRGCSIIPTSIGGDAYVAMPLEIHFSNDIVKGTVNKLSDDFTFTADVSTGG